MQDMYIEDKAIAHEPGVPLTDSYLISLLQPRYAADDVAGFGARARKVEQVFRSTSVAQALPLFARLRLRTPETRWRCISMITCQPNPHETSSDSTKSCSGKVVVCDVFRGRSTN